MQQYFLIRENKELKLSENDLYHFKVVMRGKNNDEFIGIIDSKRYYFRYKTTKDSYYLEELYEIESDSELGKDIRLYQALIRNENFDLVVQKSTELGVKEIVPTVFDRNVVKIEKNKEDNKIARYQSIASMASNQSHRNVIPEVLRPINVLDIKLSDGEFGLVAYEKNKDTKSLSALKDDLLKSSKISIVIGPEGGITEKEYNTLINKGFKSISLGKRILRSETASISLLSMLDYIIECEENWRAEVSFLYKKPHGLWLKNVK